MADGDGRLTTHVLDTMHGGPAAGVRIELRRLDDGTPMIVRDVRTNADGRVDGGLLVGADMQAGRYELLFHIGDYFRARGVSVPDPAFLDVVPVRFGIADAAGHYHVPLLASPWAYSTYRGS
jgi:5-hydroxyisourate hydrolase